MDYLVKGADIHLYQPDLDLDETLDCGQAFRWERIGDKAYHGYRINKPLEICAEKDYFVLKDTSEKELTEIWADYFDLDTDYGELKRIFSEDETLSKACAYAGGIRLLRQDSWEALLSFIISQNNNIPRIKGIIGRLCAENGGFPSAGQLYDKTADDLSYLRAGFRAGDITDCVSRIRSGELDLERVRKMPVEDARKALMTVRGIGPKVAECALLYGMYRVECFPVDVWIKRVMAQFYPDGFPEFAKAYAGIAQQYLFHYMRTAGVYTEQQERK